MKTLNPKLVLDPMWICHANFVDLEYYNYILLAAKQKYLANLVTDFSNFYEILFHYLNLNTILADKKIYNSQLIEVLPDKNLNEIVSQLSNNGESNARDIIKMALSIFADIIKEYLTKQITVLQHFRFHFNNINLHKHDKIYIVGKSDNLDTYEVYKLNCKANKQLGYSITKIAVLHIPDLQENEFNQRLLLEKPGITDFDPTVNVIIVSGIDHSIIIDGICLTKDIILLNRIMNPVHGFDANVLLDYSRLLDKKKSIPFKLKA